MRRPSCHPTTRERSLGGAALLVIAMGALLAGCATTPTQPPGQPPSPESISRDRPGGDAHDPHRAALLRLLHEKWGFRKDKDGQLVVPLPDVKHHKRVRYWAIDHFVGFRYGKDYHVMNVAFVQDVPEGTPTDSRTCLRRAEKWGHPQLRAFEVKLGRRDAVEQTWHGHDVLVKTVDGYIDFGLKRRHFSAAYAAYPAYPNACLVFAMAVPWRDQEQLAREVRDRWVREAVPLIKPLTETRPYRK